MYPAILFMILVAFAVFCLINAKRIIWNFEKSSLGRPLSETPPLKWRILLALLFLIASAFTAFTAYILLGDTLFGVAPCVVAIGMGHQLRNFRAKRVLGQPSSQVLPPPHPRPSCKRKARLPSQAASDGIDNNYRRRNRTVYEMIGNCTVEPTILSQINGLALPI